MTKAKRGLVVLLDEGAPILAGDPFQEQGHRVIYHGDVLESGSKDELVATTAILNGAALIAVDRDMKRIVRRFGAAVESPRFAKLDLIAVCCNEVLAAKRIAHAMSFIELEWSVSRAKNARRLWVDIGPHRLTTYR